MAPPSPRPRVTPRKTTAERRVEVAAAALRLIGERGLKALTAANLADAVGVTPGALYRHFASLDEVLEVAVEHAIARVEESFPPADLPARERLRRLTEGRVALIRATPGLGWLLLSDEVYLALPEKAVARLRDLVGRSRTFLRDAVVEGQADGSLRSDLEAAVMLTILSGTVHALAGSSGVHAGARKPATGPEPGHVLASLFKLLSSPPEDLFPSPEDDSPSTEDLFPSTEGTHS